VAVKREYDNVSRRLGGLMHRGLVLASFLLATAAAAQENGYQYAYLSHVEGEVTLQRASESEPESGALNVPLQPGDRIWTHGNSRAEIRIGSGLVVHLSESTKLDLVANDADTILRLWSGSAILKVSEATEGRRLDTPAGSVRPVREGSYRADIEGGDAVTLSVERGSAELASSHGTVLVQSGETSFATPTEAPSIPAPFNTARIDDFDRWSDSREARRMRTEDIVVRSLPREVRSYAYELEDYGSWYQEPDYGYVWYPRVEVGWAPYTYGRWGYTHWGHTWISSEPWGWAPYHYGRWGWGHRGWYWIPGAVWGPAWVSFAIGPTWVGWSPLGFYGGPVFGFHSYYGGYKYPYYGGHYRGGWNVCSRDDFRAGVVTRAGYRRLEPDSVRASVSNARFVNGPSSLDRDLNPRTARVRSGGASAGTVRSRGEEAIRGFRERASAPSPRVVEATSRAAASRSTMPREREETPRSTTPRAVTPREERPNVFSNAFRRGREVDGQPAERELPERGTRGAVERSRPLETETPRSTRERIFERPNPTETRRSTPPETRRSEPAETRGSDRFERVRERVSPIFTPPSRSETPSTRSSVTPRTESRGMRTRAPETGSSSRSRGGVERSPVISSPRSQAPSMESPSRRQMSSTSATGSSSEGRSSRERSSSVGSPRSSRSGGTGATSSGGSRGSQSSRGSSSGQRGSARPRSNRN
jgi:FecR protein